MSVDGQGTVAVVGSGAAGIASAFRLHEAGFRVRILERNDHLGGRMRTVSRDGFRMEQGATAIPCSYTSILGVARDAGLGAELVPAAGVFGFLGRDGALHEIDAARPLDGLTTKVISHRSKLRGLRLAAEVLRHRRRISVEDLSPLADLDTMSAEAYGRRLMGDELFDRIADPIIRSLEGCGAADVSAVDLLFVFGKFLSDPNFVVFRGGMQSYPELMANRFDVELGAEVVDVHEREDGVDLRWRGATGAEISEAVDGAVLACDADTVAGILPGLDGWRRDFLRDQVRFTHMTACTVAVEPRPDPRSCLIFPAPDVHPTMPMITLEHNIVAGRAPEGSGIVTLYAAAAAGRALYDEPDDVVSKVLIEAAAPVIAGLADSVLWTQVWRHHPCVVQSRPGYWKAMGEFRARSTSADRRIRLAGDYFCVSNLNSASASGERAARELIAQLGPGGRNT